MPYQAPLGRTREIIDICHLVWKRERVTYDGRYYTLPLPPEQGTGLGKPLKIIPHLVRDSIPIYVASLGPKNVAMTAEVADGWLPLFYVPERAGRGVGRRSGRRARPSGQPTWVRSRWWPGGSWPSARTPAPWPRWPDQWWPSTWAAWVPGARTSTTTWPAATGSRPRPRRSRTSTWTGRKDEAAAKVPDELLALTNLCGPEGWVKERIAAFKESGVTTLTVTPVGDDPLAIIEKLKAWSE